jgi:hypothetical protein
MSTTDERSFTTPDGTRLALYRQGSRDAPVTIVRDAGPYAGAGHLVTLQRAEQVADRIEELVCSVESGQRWPAE